MEEKQGIPSSAPPPYPGPGYPASEPLQTQQPYPSQGQPGYPAMTQPGPYPGYPPQGQPYPAQYPPPPGQPPAYNTAQPGYPAPQPGYPAPQPGYPAQGPYPAAGGYQVAGGYPSQAPTFTTQHNVTVVQTGAPAIVVGGVIPPDYCALSWFACLFCFWPVGICAVINSNHTRDAIARGDYASAGSHSALARKYANWAIGIGISIIVLIVILRVALVAAY